MYWSTHSSSPPVRSSPSALLACMRASGWLCGPIMQHCSVRRRRLPSRSQPANDLDIIEAKCCQFWERVGLHWSLSFIPRIDYWVVVLKWGVNDVVMKWNKYFFKLPLDMHFKTWLYIWKYPLSGSSPLVLPLPNLITMKGPNVCSLYMCTGDTAEPSAQWDVLYMQ